VKLSVIVPVLEEAQGIEAHLSALAPLRANGAEVILVDGGSSDDTRERAEPLADRVVIAPRGRAAQMNAGAALASGDVLLFLHADTRLPPDADGLIASALSGTGRVWGRFDVAIDGRHALLPVVARLMNARSRATGIATGDQAIFVTREAFRAVRGYPEIALMEDVALSRALKRVSPPAASRERVVTSGRRWETRGVLRTIATMWRLRLAFFLGASPGRLARAYGYRPRDA
jgi:rSAM/selenodomain-associated transferase 2